MQTCREAHRLALVLIVALWGAREARRNGVVYQVGEDAFGRLWVGTGAGVELFGEGWHVPFGQNQGLPGDTPNGNSFLADADGTVWVGTTSGLGRFEGGATRARCLRPG